MAFGADGAGQDAREISATRRQLGDLHALANASEGQQFSGLSIRVPGDVFRRTYRIGKHRLKCSRDLWGGQRVSPNGGCRETEASEGLHTWSYHKDARLPGELCCCNAQTLRRLSSKKQPMPTPWQA